jgi:Fic-DOC domain mobile mystery protein B
MSFETPENATPIDDYSDLLVEGIRTSKDLNRAESANIAQAQSKYLFGSRSRPSHWFSVPMLRNIHRAMFGNIWAWAGQYRRSSTRIGIQPCFIPVSLEEHCREVLVWQHDAVELTFVEMAARIHHRLVQIHPFENGNGRFSRLVADRFLIGCKCPHASWPDNLNQNGAARSTYIQALQQADKGFYEPLIEFMVEHGAKDPTPSELLRNRVYRSYVQEQRGTALLRALLRRGASPDDFAPNGHRALQLALRANLSELATLLIEAGADLHTPDQSGQTPFEIAVSQKNKTVADLLISRGARPTIPPGLGHMDYDQLYKQL